MVKSIVERSQLYLSEIILSELQLKIRDDKKLRDEIYVNIGAPQGECLSSIIFTTRSYLSTLENEQLNISGSV